MLLLGRSNKPMEGKKLALDRLDGSLEGRTPKVGAPDSIVDGTELTLERYNGAADGGAELILGGLEGLLEGTETGLVEETVLGLGISDGPGDGTELPLEGFDVSTDGTEMILGAPEVEIEGAEPMLGPPDGLTEGYLLKGGAVGETSEGDMLVGLRDGRSDDEARGSMDGASEGESL